MNLAPNTLLKMAIFDTFNSLVSMPAPRFVLFFCSVYILLYCFWATLYMIQNSKHCLSHVSTFQHALWFSVHTGATIGYGHMAPNPDCTLVNLTIMGQTIFTALIQAALLGVVFARFSAPSSRAKSIRFSQHLLLYRNSQDGFYRLALRIANQRKRQILHPKLRMLFLKEGYYSYHELAISPEQGPGDLWLGVPCVCVHIIDCTSVLYSMLDELKECTIEAEIVVLLDGVDESSARPIQARSSYSVPDDLIWDEKFEEMLSRNPRTGVLEVDFSKFDTLKE